jgi:hypothetical protein
LWGALVFDAILVLMYALTAPLTRTPTHKPLIFLFDLNGEGNIPAWFSGAQLLLVGLAFFALAAWFFQSDERVAPLRRLFFVAGLAFTWLSADEVGQIHENLSAMLQSWHPLNVLEIKLLAAMGKKVHKLHGGSIWIPIFALIGIGLVWWLWPQLKLAWKTWRAETLLLGVGFGLLVFGAVVVESLGDLIPKGATVLRLTEVGIEEGIELVGASIILYAVVRVVGAVAERLLLKLDAGDVSPSDDDAPPVGDASLLPAE